MQQLAFERLMFLILLSAFVFALVQWGLTKLGAPAPVANFLAFFLALLVYSFELVLRLGYGAP